KKIFLSAADLKQFSIDDLQLQISPDPKSEAAQGLVYETALRADKKNLSPNQCISGENFSVNAQSLTWSDIVDIDRLYAGAVADHNLPQLTAFLVVLNSCCLDFGFKPIPNIDKLLKGVAQSLPSELIKWKAHNDQSQIEV